MKKMSILLCFLSSISYADTLILTCRIKNAKGDTLCHSETVAYSDVWHAMNLRCYRGEHTTLIADYYGDKGSSEPEKGTLKIRLSYTNSAKYPQGGKYDDSSIEVEESRVYHATAKITEEDLIGTCSWHLQD